jgi:uncharacterized protein (DUF1499 family)
MRGLQKIQPWVLAMLLMVMASCATTRELTGNDMKCPDSPNCVSSQAPDARHFIEPFRFKDRPAAAMQRLRAAIIAEKRISIVSEQPDYLHAEVRSLLFRFVDDLEFRLQAEDGLIQVRSAARTGYSDFGVNRRRIERIRQVFQGQQRP